MKITSALIFLLLSFPQNSFPAVQESSVAPGFVLKDLRGGTVELTAFQGKVVLVNFWAVWCGTCKEELPALDALFREYRDKGFVVIAIAASSPQRTLSRFLTSTPLTFPVLIDDGSASAAYGCVHLPTSFLIGRDGKIHSVHKGFGKELLHVHEREIIELLKLP